MKYAEKTLCDGGYIPWGWRGDEKERFATWRIHRCPRCHVIVLPFNIRYVDPTYFKHMPGSLKREIQYKFVDFKFKRKHQD